MSLLSLSLCLENLFADSSYMYVCEGAYKFVVTRFWKGVVAAFSFCPFFQVEEPHPTKQRLALLES